VGDVPSFRAPTGFHALSVEVHGPSNERPVRITHSDPAWRVSLVPDSPLPLGWYQLGLRFPPQGVVEVIARISFANGEEFWLRVPASERNVFAAVLRLAHVLERITLFVSGSGYLTRIEEASFQRLGFLSATTGIATRAWQVMRRDGFRAVRSAMNFAVRFTRPEVIAIAGGSSAVRGERQYDTWIRMLDEAPEQHRERHEEREQFLSKRPLVSCIAAVLAFDRSELEQLASGLDNQVYRRWELVIAAPNAIAAPVAEFLAGNGLKRGSFRIIAQQSDLASTFNGLVAESSGDFVIQIPAGAQLRAHALLEFAMALERHPQAKLIYADDDRIDGDGRRTDPKFKPAWCPDLFTARDYIRSPALLHRQTVIAAGGWQAALWGAHEHDLKLRIVDCVEPRDVVHIAKILMHCSEARTINMEIADADTVRPQTVQAIQNHVARRGLGADVVIDDRTMLPRLRYRASEPPALVSLLIPTRDRAALLETCVRSIVTLTQYKPIEIIIIDNGSTEEATHRLFSTLRKQPQIRILPCPGPFNFSALNNVAAREARGAVLGLINNDIEVIDGNWLAEMVAFAVRPDIGCVGAKLLYPDGRIQHAGVFVGIGGAAAHGFRFLPREAPGYMGRLHSVQNVTAVTAACMLVRKSIYEDVGGLDEGKLTVAFNDIDFCMKVRAAGYLNVWTPFAELIHHESISRGRDNTREKAGRFAAELKTLQQRWGGKLLADPYYSPNLTYDLEDFSVRVR
jgi:O-antigen biosynthesis protein